MEVYRFVAIATHFRRSGVLSATSPVTTVYQGLVHPSEPSAFSNKSSILSGGSSFFVQPTWSAQMEKQTRQRASFKLHLKIAGVHRVFASLCAVLFFGISLIPMLARAQTPQQVKPPGSNPTPEPAIPAILAAFGKYDVVGLPAAHGFKDVDDFIFALIRDPAFSEKVNDIAVECGNSFYQPVLDRYIAGEDVPFVEARKAWRNTSQFMCSTSPFFEQLFPLVRALNQKVPSAKRLRVLACDPAIDWEQIKTRADYPKGFDRDMNAATVMENEVFSKHHKALMLFGIYHLTHAADPKDPSAVSIYEKKHPNLTFVVSDLGTFDTDSPALSSSPFVSWPIPSLTRAAGTWLGALDLSQFLPAGISIDQDCNVHMNNPKSLQRPMEDFVDAFLYFGPQDLRLKEQMPVDVRLDSDYMTELQRRNAMSGFDMIGTLKEFDQKILSSAENPLLGFKQADTRPFVKRCLDRKAQSNPPK